MPMDNEPHNNDMPVTAEYFGQTYTAVEYEHDPTRILQSDEDPQCLVCAVEPNYCRMHDKCHGECPFVFVKSRLASAIDTAMKVKAARGNCIADFNTILFDAGLRNVEGEWYTVGDGIECFIKALKGIYDTFANQLLSNKP